MRMLLVFVIATLAWCQSTFCATSSSNQGTTAVPNVAPIDQVLNEVEAIKLLEASRTAAMVTNAISPNSQEYRAIERLGESHEHKAAAVKELIRWLFVREPRPETFEKIGTLRLYPAARALIAIGDEAMPSLIQALKQVATKEDGMVVIKSLEAIQGKSKAHAQLRLLKKELGTSVVGQLIDRVLAEE